jgi:hypothetical protein
VDSWRIGPLILVALLATLALLAIPRQTHPHDSWISRQGLRNAAGEWCCGAGDCMVLDPAWIVARADGYHVAVRAADWVEKAIRGEVAPPARNEIVPYSEAQLSPDGAFWRCKRPDGSRRCFFAPRPSS